MIERTLDDIDAADLARLIEAGRPEGRRLDYKLTLPGRGDADTKEFLADITALANTDGGDLIYGMRDVEGVAAELVGLPTEGLDGEILRLESLVRDGMDPRVPRVRFHVTPLEGDRVALIARVGASLVAPHRVTLKGTSRFFARNSRGKYEMDTGELRLAFAASDQTPRKLRDLHTAAVQAISGENMPCRLEAGPALVLTLAPLSILREPRDLAENALLPPLHGRGYDMAVGLDGVIAFVPLGHTEEATTGWAVNHRRGYIDVATVIGATREGQGRVWPQRFREALFGTVRHGLTRLRNHGVEGPWTLMATVLGVRDFMLIGGYDFSAGPAFQNIAYLGEVLDDTLANDSLEPLWAAFLRLFGVEDPRMWKVD
ncbi:MULTISPECIES: helix-turn-helix domain-containing protein [Caulobacter]|uniref:AlbA family DNA-binding domain-containing protein n=1 Tax=Caulobacter TaxID=75 RepID=UPI000785128A|nr:MULTISPECIES: ATP-binding protein [Caulobacter]ATC24323.1 ATP-binding protein [Caulobacter vibrioides]MBQ1561980.1 ATP-binding protein [Caulobacter sp.]MCK5908354.1 ATP-binding protein [Caulobacter sp.]PIB97078.1 ATP-binding protein [Caulobacter sp. X]